jgi:hypothetical protein
MNRYVCASFLTLLSCAPCWAQSSTATGTGVGVAKSSSASQAVAISGQGGRGGNSNSSLTVTTPANTTATVNQNLNTSGTSTIKNVPTVFAPGLAAAGLETCLGSVSAGVGVIGTGVSFGTTIPDPGCAARLDARTLWSMGLQKAAVTRLCLQPDIYRSMSDVCDQYLPHPPQAGYLSAAAEPQMPEGGPVELINSRTGVHFWCLDYDAARRRCRARAH